MGIINTSKPTTALTNTTKVSFGLTWDAATMTWDAATFIWDSAVSIIKNISAGVMGFLWSIKRFPWTELTPWLSEGGMTNQSKP